MRETSRREVLAGAAAALAVRTAEAQTPAGAASVTSSVMLWTLSGSFEDRLAAAAEAGLQSVQLVREQDRWSAVEIDKVRKRLRSFGLMVDAISSNPNFGSQPISPLNPAERPALLAEVERQLKIAERLGAPMALFMAGNRLAGGASSESQWASLVESARRAGDLAARYGITLIVEPLNTKVNHKGYFLENCSEGARLIREVNHDRVRLLYDLYHEHVQTGDALKALEQAAPFVKVFHVADNPGRHDPGTGTMDWKAIYAAIRKLAFKGHVAMEYLPAGAPAPSLAKAVDAMRAALIA